MNNTHFAIASVIRQIEDASHKPGQCWRFALRGADVLLDRKQSSVDELLQLLLHKDTKVVALSMLYLGMLNEMGLDTTRAVEPIRQATARDPEILVFTAGLALAMIGDPAAVSAIEGYARQTETTTRECKRRGIATVVEYVAGNLGS
jgi:HEAT repeat protein